MMSMVVQKHTHSKSFYLKYTICCWNHTVHCCNWNKRSEPFNIISTTWLKKVQVGKDQEKTQSEKDSHSESRGGKKPN